MGSEEIGHTRCVRSATDCNLGVVLENLYSSDRSTRVYPADEEDIRSSGLVRVNDGLYAEVPLWCVSGPIAHRQIDLVCLEAY
jgi:hypothetical protein